MPRRKSSPTLKMSMDSTLRSGAVEPPRPTFVTNGKVRKTAVVVKRPTRVLSVRDSLVRIQTEADPLGFLIDIQNGALIECHYVDEAGTVHTRLEQAALSDRVTVAKFLVNKVLPSLTVTKHMVTDSDNVNEGDVRPGAPGAPSFAALVAAASAKSVNAEIVDGGAADDRGAGSGGDEEHGGDDSAGAPVLEE